MIRRLAVCSGIFLLMALSNAVVPVLDVFAIGPEKQGLVFSAYFFGATLMVLPAGMAADRFSRRRLMQVGLGVSLLAGLVIAVAPNVWSIVGARFVEGVATGLFVSAGLAHVNSQADNGRSSGAFMASLNAGLLAGLILTGLLVELTGLREAGVLAFASLSLLPFLFSFSLEQETVSGFHEPLVRLGPMLSQYHWLFYASLVMFGAGGAVTGLYPEFSNADPGLLGVQIALQNVATIVAVVVVSRLAIEPIPLIRACGGFMALAVAVSFLTPYGFALIGAAGALPAAIATNIDVDPSRDNRSGHIEKRGVSDRLPTPLDLIDIKRSPSAFGSSGSRLLDAFVTSRSVPIKKKLTTQLI